jgi:acetyl esterase/lipase
MTYRFAFRGFALLPFHALLLLLLSPQVSGAQGSSSTPSDANTATPTAQATPNVSKGVKERSSTEDVTALLTKEDTPVSSNHRPMFVEKAEVPNTSFIRETYRAEWRTGDPFYIYVIRPKGVSKPPVILYLPSFPDDTDLFKNNNWCDLAVRGGYAAVGFVGNVTGHRTRYRLLKEWFVSEMPEALTTTTHDVQLILDYLATRGDLDMERVAMFGNGSGGAIAVLASVVDSRIKVLDLQAPWGDWKDWLRESKVVPEDERAQYAKEEFVASVLPLDPVAWLPKIHAKSLRIEDIRGNKAMPDKAQEKLEGAAPDFALINQYGNGRAFLAAQVPFSVLDWVKSQLAADAKPQAALEKSVRIHFFPAVQPPPAPSTISNLAGSAAPQVAKSPAPANEKEKVRDNPR